MLETNGNGTHAIRIVLAELSGLLGAVVRSTLEGERDMVVVADIASTDDLAEALRHHVDVVVTSSASSNLAAPFRALLFSANPVPVAVVSADGSRIDVYGHSITYGGGLDSLTGLIREAVEGARPHIGGA